ncbi:MAG: hypothetical protein CL917_03340 [Deltaproteobacteria bacterium]|nr:hypothetical protein [Deltaproteobacteria bacterium]
MGQDIAIVGMAVRVPGANTLDEFWNTIVSGKDCLTRLNKAEQESYGILASDYASEGFVASKPWVSGMESFDAQFFGISDVQAKLMDPAHRLFLECVWEAMEQAGALPGDVEGLTGVFASIESQYFEENLKVEGEGDPATRVSKRLGTLMDYVSLRVSHVFDLKGPSLTAVATCSSSLMAVNLAAQSLRTGKCTAALAGGVRTEFPHSPGYRTGVDGMISAEGVIRPFDATADGTIFGDGAGVVLLKMLDRALLDGDDIKGVILGSGFCNDGQPDEKQSFIAPTRSGQKRAIREALDEGGVDPATIGFVECHGTGTLLGDPIEIESLDEIFSESESESAQNACAIGSIKGNIGHLGPAAGVVGLIKASLVLSNHVIPPMANYSESNPNISWEETPFFVPRHALEWKRNGKPNRAGVSSFGFGGSNAHVILEEYIAPELEDSMAKEDQELIVVSAKTQVALERRLSDLAGFCEASPKSKTRDLAYTLQVGREAMPFRSHFTVEPHEVGDLPARFRTAKPTGEYIKSSRPVVFMFPGQGSQSVGMGKGLYENEPVYREAFDYCSDFLVRELEIDLRDCVFGRDGSSTEDAEAALKQTAIAQPALFAVEYSLAKQFESWGLVPSAMLGHSLGELVAACLGGVFSLDDALRLVAIRSRLMQKCAPGSMLAVSMPLDDLMEVLPEELDLAAVNSLKRNVVAGQTDDIANFAKFLKTKRVSSQSLATSHAFHSRMLDETLEEFREELKGFKFSPATQTVISGVTGKPLTEAQARDPEYWIEQRRKPVLFSDALHYFFADQDPIFVEIGPGRALSGFVNQNDSSRDALTALYRGKKDLSSLAHTYALDTLGEVWAKGGTVDWPKRSDGRACRKLALPTYPFQRRYYWENEAKPPEASEHAYPLSLYEPGWAEKNVEDEATISEDRQWLVFADDEGLADAMIERLAAEGEKVRVVRPGERYEEVSSGSYEMSPSSREGLNEILSSIELAGDGERLRVLNFWNVSGSQRADSDLEAYRESKNKGFHFLIGLMQVAREFRFVDRLDVQMYVDGLAQVNPEEDLNHPEKGILLGPARVSTQEVKGLSIRCIDIPAKAYSNDAGGLIQDIWSESFVDAADAIVALRSDGRYAEQLFALPEVSSSQARLRYGGTVLITGGVGGLGLKVAEELFNTLNAQLVLTSRWAPPPREDWSRLMQEDSKLGRAMRTLSPLVERGAKIEIVQADVSSVDDMRRVVDVAHEKMGGIHGVIHTAGILDDGPSLQKTFASAERVFLAKVESAYVLEELFGAVPLDIFVHFSSQASLRPSKGQVDYSSANAVLDRLAIRRQQTQSGLSCAIGWGAWRDAGMAWEYKSGDMSQNSLFRDKALNELSDTMESVQHSLLEGYRQFSDGDILFSGQLVRDEHWITSEHFIGGEPVVSGTTVVEMMRAAFMDMGVVDGTIELSDMTFIRRFEVKTVTDYEILFVNRETHWQVELRTRVPSEGPDWHVTSTAKIACTRQAAEIAPDVLEEILSGRETETGPVTPPVNGPRWSCHWGATHRDSGVVARLALQPEFTGEVNDFVLHPALLDRSIHTLTDEMFGVLLPYSCEKLRIFGNLPAETLSYGVSRKEDADTMLDIWITDLEGNLLVQLEGYMAKDYDSIYHTRAGSAEVVAYDADVDHRMVLDSPGNLDSFRLEAQAQVPLESHEVRIKVKAAGLNFRDVLSGLGQLPEGDPSRDMRGSECSGVITEVGEDVSHLAVGDKVIAFANHCFSTNVRADGHMVTLLPECLSFTDGASLPITFLTVEYALNEAARLQEGERILIHAGTGGVGLAAVQFAQSVGAEIYATAGQDFKRDYLRDLGVEHVFDSRSLDFVDEIKEVTDGEGVDVVLNALAGEFIPASMSLLKPFGRFLEIGKKDIYADTPMGLYPFRNNLSYHGIDLGQWSEHRREDLLKMFEKLMRRFSSGALRPSPVRVFPLTDIDKGFEFLARTQHIGKVVFSVDQNMTPDDLEVQNFNARFGTGIGMRDGLDALNRLVCSDEAPAQVMAAAEALDSLSRLARHQSGGALRRVVDTEYRDPQSTTEELLKQIWEQTLGVTPIGVDDDFAELGGDSITAIMLQVSVADTFNLDLSLSALLSFPTIAILGEKIDESTSD